MKICYKNPDVIDSQLLTPGFSGKNRTWPTPPEGVYGRTVGDVTSSERSHRGRAEERTDTAGLPGTLTDTEREKSPAAAAAERRIYLTLLAFKDLFSFSFFNYSCSPRGIRASVAGLEELQDSFLNCTQSGDLPVPLVFSILYEMQTSGKH